MNRLRNFCSLHGSHTRKRMPPVHQQGTNNTVVQHKGCTAGNIHILLPSRAFHFSKQGLIPFKIQLWLKNTEVTDRATNAEVWRYSQKGAGTSGGAFPSRTNAFRRLRSTIQSFSTCRDTLLRLLQLGLLRPEKPITFFEHALYQGSEIPKKRNKQI